MPKLSKDSLAHKWLNVEDFEYLCFNFAREYLTFNEPIPDYSTRNVSLLESSLASPKQVFAGELLYPTLEKQAAILFYSLIKNHPFQNGNKRIAVIAMLVLLSINGKWLKIKPLDLYFIANKVSESKSNEMRSILRKIEKTLKLFLENYK